MFTCKPMPSENADISNDRPKPSAFARLSIQRRLPFFICILLLTVVLVFSWISYLGVRRASMDIGSERVGTLADKLSLMFKTGVDQVAAQVQEIAGQQSLRDLLATGEGNARAKTHDIFQNFLKKDTTNKVVLLLDSARQPVYSAGAKDLQLKVDVAPMTTGSKGKAGYIGVGRFVTYKRLIYYPVIAPVMEKGKTLGYVLTWKLLHTTREGIEQMAQLLGGNGKLYFGNDDATFWTDLMNPTEGPPVDVRKLQQVVEYSRAKGGPLLGSVRKIPDSHWLILVEMSSSSFLKTANIYLRWVFIIGITLVVIGSIGGWILSRSITRPLHELSRAAAAIAEGDYSAHAKVNSGDELGRLAESFNIMAARVGEARQGLEQKVEETTKELETAITDINDQRENEKKKDEFISIASHELKTPLTTIKAFFQIAVKEMDPGFKSYNLIDKASRQVNRMERLIGDLLDVSKINAGKMQYDEEDFDFQQVLKDAVDNVQEIFPAHKIVIENTVPAVLHGDRHRIEQVIVNLLINAVKYSPRADKVLIRAELSEGRLVVTIEDFGIGIDETHIGGLFDRFYRVDGSHNYQGLGLGLFISSEIIKRHGGSISVKSEPGKGSAFTFQLPVASRN